MSSTSSDAFTTTFPPEPVAVVMDAMFPPSFCVNRLVDTVMFPAFPAPKVVAEMVLKRFGLTDE